MTDTRIAQFADLHASGCFVIPNHLFSGSFDTLNGGAEFIEVPTHLCVSRNGPAFARRKSNWE